VEDKGDSWLYRGTVSDTEFRATAVEVIDDDQILSDVDLVSYVIATSLEEPDTNPVTRHVLAKELEDLVL
jgi:hypothetical protein